MAITTLDSSHLEVVKWRKRIYHEYRAGNKFTPYMGESTDNIIHVYGDLDAGKQGGDQIVVPFVGDLSGPGVSKGPLVGNEERLDTYGHKVWADWARNGVLLKKSTLRRSTIDQLAEVRPALSRWGKTVQKNEFVLAFDSIPSVNPPRGLDEDAPRAYGPILITGGRVNGILWNEATEVERDAFFAANDDRIVVGNLLANNVSDDWNTSMANLDTVGDRAGAAHLRLLREVAASADPGIAPYMLGTGDEQAGEEYYVLFVGDGAWRDYAADPDIIAANLHARPREGNSWRRNPIFGGGNLTYEGVVIVHVPEITKLALKPAVGAGSIAEPEFLCGQGALAWAWGQMPEPTERKEDDYGMLIGRGVEMVYGVAKTARKVGSKLVQHGMVTGYVSVVARG